MVHILAPGDASTLAVSTTSAIPGGDWHSPRAGHAHMLMLMLANSNSVTAIRLTSTCSAADPVDGSLPACRASRSMRTMPAPTRDASSRSASLHPRSPQSESSADDKLCNCCCLITRLCCSSAGMTAGVSARNVGSWTEPPRAQARASISPAHT